MARNGRSSSPRSRPGREKRCYLLHMAARALPGAADGSKWLLEPAPEPQHGSKWLLEPASEPQLARNGRSSALESAPEQQCSTGAARVCLGTAECSTDAARATPEAQNARRVPLEPAQEPQHARKVPLEPTAVRCVRFLRSEWPFEKCCPLFVLYRDQLLLGSTLLRACYARVHTS